MLGQGYVGLSVAMRAVEVGFDVVGFDPDTERIGQLRAGESRVHDVDPERLLRALRSGRFHPTTRAEDIALFDIAVIAVPTPILEGIPDLTFVESAAATLASFVRPGSTVVLESTTFPGTTDALLVPLLEQRSKLRAGRDFFVGYSPERIDPGNDEWTFQRIPKIVSGIDDASLRSVKAFYNRLVDRTVVVSGTREAELAKLLENTFRQVNIALVNEMAIVAHALGIDVWESIDAASTKPFGYLRFVPGPGVGGHCVPVDPSYLSWHVERILGIPFRCIELAADINNQMPYHVVRRIQALLNDRRRSVNGSRVLVFGLAYKANTGDSRESPAIRVCRELLRLGAEVLAADPHVAEASVPVGVTRVEGSVVDLATADLVAFLVDHDEFDRDAIGSIEVPVFDCRHVLKGPTVHYL